MAPVETSRSRSGSAPGTVRIVLIALAIFWALSQFGQSPLDQALSAVGADGGGMSAGEYNEQQRRDGVFDDINGCPDLDDCNGLDPDPLDQLPGY